MFSRRGRFVLLSACVGILLLGACGPAATPTERVKVDAAPVTDQPTPTHAIVVTAASTATKTSIPTTVHTAEAGEVGVLFKDHFDTGIGSWFTGPDSSIYAYCDAGSENGKYTMYALINTDNAMCYAHLPAFSASDGTITFQAAVSDTTAGEGQVSVGVIWRQDDEGTNESFYFFNDGTYRMLHWEKGSDEELVPRTYSEYMNFKQGMTNVISVTAVGKLFTVFANGHALYAVTSDKANAKGKIGLLIGADKVGQKLWVDFDDVLVTLPVDVPTTAELVAMAPTSEPSPMPTKAAAVNTPLPRPTVAPVTAAPPTAVPPTAAPVTDKYIMYFHFGAQGCQYSRRTGPAVETLSKNYAGRVQVIGVPVNGWGSDVEDFRRATGISFPIEYGAGPSINTSRIPMIVLVNQSTGRQTLISQGIISYESLANSVTAVMLGQKPAMSTGSS